MKTIKTRRKEREVRISKLFKEIQKLNHQTNKQTIKQINKQLNK